MIYKVKLKAAERLWARVPNIKTRSYFHINMCPETFNLWAIAERKLCRHQQRFSINVWLGIVCDYLVGPHVLPHRFAGNRYRDFLLHDLPKLLEFVRERMWYNHDGAPAHFSRAVRDVFNNTHHNRWIGRGGPTAWPPRLPDLNPLDFYLCGYLKLLCTQLLLEMKGYINIALWMPVRLSATTLACLKGRGRPW
jgi:hypothetical protein